MIKFLLSITFSILIISESQTQAAEKISSFLVHVNPMKMRLIAEHFEVVQKRGKSFEVYVQDKDLPLFKSLAPNAQLLLQNIHTELENKGDNLGKYRKYADVENDLLDLASKYKDLASLETYGQTKAGRKLYALKVSSKTHKNTKPQIMITAATHGDELITTEVLFKLMGELLAGYNNNQRLTKIIDDRDIYFIPVVSPDSFEARERYVQGLDPNRSYPWPENTSNKTIDCIQAMMDFTNSHNFVGSLDLHAYGKLVMYPWAYTDQHPKAADEVVMSDLVRQMARQNQYTAGQISTTIYIAKGSSADYFYWKKNTQAIAVELTTSKVPNYSSIPKVVDEAREMTWVFLEHFN